MNRRINKASNNKTNPQANKHIKPEELTMKCRLNRKSVLCASQKKTSADELEKAWKSSIRYAVPYEMWTIGDSKNQFKHE